MHTRVQSRGAEANGELSKRLRASARTWNPQEVSLGLAGDAEPERRICIKAKSWQASRPKRQDNQGEYYAASGKWDSLPSHCAFYWDFCSLLPSHPSTSLTGLLLAGIAYLQLTQCKKGPEEGQPSMRQANVLRGRKSLKTMPTRPSTLGVGFSVGLRAFGYQ